MRKKTILLAIIVSILFTFASSASAATVSITPTGATTDLFVPGLNSNVSDALEVEEILTGGTTMNGPGAKAWSWDIDIAENAPCVGATVTSVRVSSSISDETSPVADFIQLVGINGSAIDATTIYEGTKHNLQPDVELIQRGQYSEGALPINGPLDADYSISALDEGTITIILGIDSENTADNPPATILLTGVSVEYDESTCVSSSTTTTTQASTTTTIDTPSTTTEVEGTTGNTLPLTGKDSLNFQTVISITIIGLGAYLGYITRKKAANL